MRDPENIKCFAFLYNRTIWALSSGRLPVAMWIGDHSKLPESIKKTGVFVDASLDYIQSTMRRSSTEGRSTSRRRKHLPTVHLSSEFGC